MELRLPGHSSPAPSSSWKTGESLSSLCSATFLFLGKYQVPLKKKTKTRSSCFSPRAFIEKRDPIYDFVNKVRGSLPIVGLLSRILSDDGGIGTDRIQFKEFCSRVYRNFPPEVPVAFFEFEDRHGSVARPQYVLLWCWAAALGAGLLKTEDMMLAATRLRVSSDIMYEEDNFNILMDQATTKRKKSKAPVPFVPYEVRAEKSLDSICRCCIGKPNIDEEDARLLTIILQGVFPAADKDEIERMVRSKIGNDSVQRLEDAIEESKENVEPINSSGGTAMEPGEILG